MSRLSDITSAAVKNLLANRVMNTAVLAINGAGAATIKTTGTTHYTINGLFKSKAALAAQSIAPTHNQMGVEQPGGYQQPTGTTVYYLVCYDAAGAVKVVQGGYDGQKMVVQPDKGIGALANMGTSFVGESVVPDTPDGMAAIGALKVVNTSGAAFVPGTTLLDAAGIAVTYLDMSLNPGGRP